MTVGMALIPLAYGLHGRTSYAPSAHTEIDVYEIDCDVPYEAPGVVRCKNVGSTRAMRITNLVSTRRMRSILTWWEWAEETVRYYLDGKLVCTQPYAPTAQP